MPAYDLAEVQRQATAARTIVTFFDEKSLDVVSEILDLDLPAAKVWIFRLLAQLTPENYAETLAAKAPPADVYGVFSEGRGWYVKFSFRHGRLHVNSCHPPTDPLRTRTETITRYP